MKHLRSSNLILSGILLTAGLAAAQDREPAGTPEQGPPQPPSGQMQPPGPPQPMGPFHGGPQGGPAPNGQPHPQPMPAQHGMPPMERAMGRWWNNPQMVERLAITADQKKKMEDIFQQYRLKLIDAKASLEKAEAVMEPLVAADTPDEAKIIAQIDKVAQARAELEKANARMLLGIRQTLTPEQWKKLQEHNPAGVPHPAAQPQPQPGPRGPAKHE